jgi:hypothetical protein
MRIKLKHISRYLIMFYCALPICGCKKLIEIDPPINSTTTGDVFKTSAQTNAALAGLYSSILGSSVTADQTLFSNAGATIYGGLSSDELRTLSGLDNNLDYQFETSKLLVENATAGGLIWSPAYKIIYSANSIMEGVAASTSSGLSDDLRKQATGESKFIRAFCYFYLTNFFGDLPMPLVSDFTKTATLSRAPQADVYSQMVLDLKDAQLNLPDDYSFANGERVRANKWAATALLSRVYLYQKDWINAEAQATAIINNAQYSLLPALTDVFLKNSKEAIWQLSPNIKASPYNGTVEGNDFIPPGVLYDVPDDVLPIVLVPDVFDASLDTWLPRYYSSSYLANAFEPNDQRKTTWMKFTPVPSYAPWNGQYIYWPDKYTERGVLGNAVTQYYTVLRLGEQYLIRAEARAEQGKISEAAADLNAIRARAGLPATNASTQTTLLTAIAHERQVELFCEFGHRFFDLKRTGQASTVLGAIGYKEGFNAHQLLYPIPPLEIARDPNLRQNPGY